jgi:opacity protein-like surface antigen
MTGTVGYNNISKPFGGYYQTKQQDAIAYAADVGYTFADHPWKPRVSAVYIYGSGNKSAYSSASNNVDQFYGFNQPFSRNDYISWNNVKDPKVRLEFTPAKDTQIDTAFSAYWLASAASAWDRAGLYAPNGNRGTFMGTELDMRIRQKVSQYWNISASYARFWPGSYTSSFAPPVALQMPPTWAPGGTAPGQTGTTYGLTARPTNFFYVEANANAFGDGKPIATLPGSEFVAYWNEGDKKSKEPSWTDLYVGVTAGGSLSNGNMKVQDLAAADGNATTYTRSNTVAATGLNTFPTNYNQSLSGFIGGLTYGANYKLANSFVVGVEGDLSGTAGNTNTVWDIFSKQNPGGSTIYTSYGQHTATLNYLGTGRGRLGYLATPELLLFGTAGFAYGGVTAANSYVTIASNAASSPNVYGPQSTGTLTGWTAGGGVEWAISPQWTVKADYLYYNLVSVQASNLGSNNTFATTSFSSTPYGVLSQSTSSFSGNIIRGGVNRHFDLLNSESKAADKPVLAAAIGAADATKKSAPAKPVNWGGAYGGVNLGGIWANQNSINNVTAWPDVNRPSQFVSSDAWLSGSVPASGTAALLGGGQIGYNVELNKLWKLKFVTGVEADIQSVTPGGSKGTNTFLTTLTPVNASNQALVSQSATNSLSFFGTARGRFGFTLTPSILAYGTGGLAYGSTNTSLQTFSGLGSLGGWQGGAGSASTFQLGWTAGGGAEWAFRDNWSVKGEYLYYDLGKASGSVTNYAYLPGAAPQLASQSQFTERYAGNILRAGVNYHIPVEKSEPVTAGY